MIQVKAIVQQALALHKEGRLAEAKALYEEIVKLEPRHFDALHLLGVIPFQRRNPEVAVALMGKALELNPNSAAAHSNRGCALNQLDRFDEALASCDRAIALRPDYAEAYNNRGNALYD